MVMADAMRGFAAAAIEPLIDAIEARPELAKRRAGQGVLESLPADQLGERLARRLAASKRATRDELAALTERAGLYLRIADVQAKSRKIVAKAICELLGSSPEEAAKGLVKLAQKALGVV